MLIIVRTKAGETSKPIEYVEVKVPLGLPKVPEEFRRRSVASVKLGRKLFFDRRLSFNNTLSCGMCHLESDAFASTQSARAVGMEGISLMRNAPSLLNVVFQKALFHDGRERKLEWQAWGPLLSPDEMANPSIGFVIDRIKSLKDYDQLFETSYPDEGLTPHTVGHALESFQSTLLSGNSRFDRWYIGGEKDALSAAEQRGFALFVGKGGCNACHTINEDHALFTDFDYHNTGIGYRASMAKPQPTKVELAPGVTTELSGEKVEAVSDKPKNDIGRFAVTLRAKDRWAYRTPSLRNVRRTFPYMHDGSIRTLPEVVDYYNKGGVAHDALSDRIKPLGLTKSERDDIVAFLRSLDGDQVEATAKSANKSDRPNE